MKNEQFEELLGIRAPWFIKEVKLDEAKKEVVVRVECEKTVWLNAERQLHVHAWEKRRWRHLDLWQCITIIEAEVPRLLDPDTGKTELVSVPWAERLSRWTKLFEGHAIETLLNTRTITAASELLKLGWDACQAIMNRAVERGLRRRTIEEVTLVGLDEKSFRRGQDYIALMTDLLGRRVLEVVEGADAAQVAALWETLPEPQRAKVEAAAMDRGKAMVAGTQQAAPHVKIVHDRFHISSDLNEAVEGVRREEQRHLLGEGDKTLTGTRYLWVSGLDKLSDERFVQFETLVKLNLKTAKAWELKETFNGFWEQTDELRAKAFFDKWHRRAVRSKLTPFVKLAKSFAEALPRLLNYFQHRITNSLTEGFNSVIQSLKAAARGFRNFKHYRTRILFFCGKLSLIPSN